MRSTVLAFLLLSARGGVAALAAWLVCRALRRAHAPSRLLCWLWRAVGLRFVLPWGIPLKLPRPESAPLAAAADAVAEVAVEAAPLAVGEEIFFLGATTGVAEQLLEELHGPDGEPVESVTQGELCAIRTPGLIRRGDQLYKFVDAE